MRARSQPAALHERETLYDTHVLGEEHRLRVSENRVLRTMLVPKVGKVTGRWIKLHNEELPDL